MADPEGIAYPVGARTIWGGSCTGLRVREVFGEDHSDRTGSMSHERREAAAASPMFTPGTRKTIIERTRSWSPTMTRFMFLVLERHRVVAPTSARSCTAPVPAL
jgi:hypothetical protein